MLSREIARQVRHLEIVTGRQVADVLAGEYLSVFKGRGMEFDEVRPYVPGDDVRTIDWNVSARMGAPYVKRYVEERELTIMLLVDVSASLDFGSRTRSKREAAVELSALIAFSASQNDDKVGLLLFHQDTELYVPPRKGQKHALRVVREVMARGGDDYGRRKPMRARVPRWLLPQFLRLGELRRREPRRSTQIAAALELSRRVLARRAVVFLVSDFLDSGYQKVLRHVHGKHDVICVLVTDQRELALPDAGLVMLEDAETGRTAVIDSGSAHYRQMAKAQAAERIERLRADLVSSGIDLIHVDATKPVVDPLVEFFRMRQKRIRR